MISTFVEVPKDAKDELFMNKRLLLSLSPWPLRWEFIPWDLFLLLLLGEQGLNILKGLRRKLMLRKKDQGKTVSKALSIFHSFQREGPHLGKAKKI